MMSAQFQAAPECVVNLSIPSIIIVISNNSWCRLWSVVMLMGHISVGLLDHLGGSILPQRFPLRVSDSGLLCIAAYIMACPIVTRRKLTQQVVNSSNITQHNVLVQAAFFVIPFVLSVMLPGSPGGA